MGGRQLLDPQSALVRTALDILALHSVAGEDVDMAVCSHCGLMYPCPPVLHARQVCDVGGVNDPVGDDDAVAQAPREKVVAA